MVALTWETKKDFGALRSRVTLRGLATVDVCLVATTGGSDLLRIGFNRATVLHDPGYGLAEVVVSRGACVIGGDQLLKQALTVVLVLGVRMVVLHRLPRTCNFVRNRTFTNSRVSSRDTPPQRLRSRSAVRRWRN